MEMPLVSVKMITYNHRDYIEPSIQSILNQKRNFPMELVIGEDCSTDGTREIVFAYQKKYPEIIRVVSSETNVGMNQNDYRTCKACKGKYIAFCEGDDFWHESDKLQKQVDFLEKNLEYGMTISDCNVYLHEHDRTLKGFNKNKRHIDNPQDLSLQDAFGFGRLHIFTCTAMMRKGILDSIVDSDPYLHQSSDFLMGDVQIWIEFVILSKVFYMPESLATYRVLGESASFSKDQLKSMNFWKSGYEMRMYICKKYNLPQKLYDEMITGYYSLLLRMSFFKQDVEEANEIRRKIKHFSLKNRLYFWGTRFPAINRIMRRYCEMLFVYRKKNMR